MATNRTARDKLYRAMMVWSVLWLFMLLGVNLLHGALHTECCDLMQGAGNCAACVIGSQTAQPGHDPAVTERILPPIESTSLVFLPEPSANLVTRSATFAVPRAPPC